MIVNVIQLKESYVSKLFPCLFLCWYRIFTVKYIIINIFQSNLSPKIQCIFNICYIPQWWAYWICISFISRVSTLFANTFLGPILFFCQTTQQMLSVQVLSLGVQPIPHPYCGWILESEQAICIAFDPLTKPGKPWFWMQKKKRKLLGNLLWIVIFHVCNYIVDNLIVGWRLSDDAANYPCYTAWIVTVPYPAALYNYLENSTRVARSAMFLPMDQNTLIICIEYHEIMR